MKISFNIHPLNPQIRIIHRAAKILSEGGIIIYPTDTVYGIGCDITKKLAIERITKIKSRSQKKPFSFICSGLKHVSQYASITNFAYPILKRFLPGPYTFILPASQKVPKLLINKQKTVGIRIPDHSVALELVRELGNPILSTSANRKDERVIGHPDELIRIFGNVVDMILECGMLSDSPSSIISLLDDKIEVLREGAGDVRLFYT